MSIRHTERIPADAWQARHIGDLIEDPGVHGVKNLLRRINPGRHQHAWLFRDGNLPNLIRNPIDRHVGVEVHVKCARLEHF